MPFWYFFKIPKLPAEISHQSNRVEIGEYLLKEGDPVKPGTPIAIVENYWARMRLKANGKGVLRRTFFRSGTTVHIGDPIAIIGADGDDIPYDKDYSLLEVIEMKRTKP